MHCLVYAATHCGSPCPSVAPVLDVWQLTTEARLLLSTRTLGTLRGPISNALVSYTQPPHAAPQVSTFVSILSGELHWLAGFTPVCRAMR